MIRPLFRTSVLAAALASAACTSPVDEPGSTVPGQCQADDSLVGPQRTDILFLIDNSGSMKEEQAAIAVELPAFIDELKRENGLVQDFRVGVITSSVYQRAIFGDTEQVLSYPTQSGRLQGIPDADGTLRPDADRFLEDEDPELVARFGRLVQQGTSGSGQEAPFEAVRLATVDLASTPIAEGGNAEFFRDGARLLVVVVTDEDDCSSTQRPPPVTLTGDTSHDFCTEQAAKLTSVDEYFRMFNDIDNGRGGTREVIWAAIAPVALADKHPGTFLDESSAPAQVRNVDCPTSYGPGYRHWELAKRFNTNLVNLDSICRPSFRQSLIDIAKVANTSQTLEVMNVPDARLLQVKLERQDGREQTCTTINGGVRYEAASGETPARVFFQGDCVRLPDDKHVSVKLICAT